MTGFDPLQPFASGSNREVPFVDKASSPEQNPAQEGRRLPLKGFASATQPASRAVGGPVNLPVRQVAAVVMGNALEFYDFGTYSYFALQIGRTFFPTQNPLSSLLLSFATFGVGFLTRPVGAVVVGRLADRTGRRPAMVLTFLLMGIAICGIALTHSYRSIGLAAPIMVLGWRLLQGFALGGEMGPTAAFLVEAAPPARRGFYGSLQFSAQAFSGFAAGLVGFGLSSVLDAQSLDNWGWRGAFMIGATVVPVGLVIRRSSPETLHAPRFTIVARTRRWALLYCCRRARIDLGVVYYNFCVCVRLPDNLCAKHAANEFARGVCNDHDQRTRQYMRSSDRGMVFR